MTDHPDQQDKRDDAELEPETVEDLEPGKEADEVAGGRVGGLQSKTC
jgi:hypothetical protein